MRGLWAFSDFAMERELVCCDESDVSEVGYTYSHEPLGHRTLIDHVFVLDSVKPLIDKYQIVVDGSNLSDHLPVRFSMGLSVPVRLDGNRLRDNKVQEFRWDKGDVTSYYVMTGMLLDKIKHKWPCLKSAHSCCVTDHCANIDILYSEIIHCLDSAARCCIPVIPKSALKHYWSCYLDELKQNSVTSHRTWIAAGRPRFGHIFDCKQNAHYKYKIAVKDAVDKFEDRFNDDMLDCYVRKD